MSFPNEHPTHVMRRLEAQNVRMRALARQLDEMDVADPAAVREALKAIATAMAEVTVATGSLALRVARGR